VYSRISKIYLILRLLKWGDTTERNSNYVSVTAAPFSISGILPA
jgi:hypothetical protein